MIVDEEVSDFLSHHGVKGQKWGIRNRREKKAHILQKVGRGEGTKREKFAATMNLSAYDIIRRGGIEKASAYRGEKLANRLERIKKGEASVKDKLQHYGETNIIDLMPAKKRRLE
jgi:hypothetical protein